MKKTLSTCEAANILIDDEFSNWSRRGAFAIVEYLEGLEYETGHETEFDRIAIRCDFTEYESLLAMFEDTVGDASNLPDDESERDDEIRAYILDHGALIEFDGGVIVSEF